MKAVLEGPEVRCCLMGNEGKYATRIIYSVRKLVYFFGAGHKVVN